LLDVCQQLLRLLAFELSRTRSTRIVILPRNSKIRIWRAATVTTDRPTQHWRYHIDKKGQGNQTDRDSKVSHPHVVTALALLHNVAAARGSKRLNGIELPFFHLGLVAAFDDGHALTYEGKRNAVSATHYIAQKIFSSYSAVKGIKLKR
jgi:hypothetical protein